MQIGISEMRNMHVARNLKFAYTTTHSNYTKFM